MEPSLIQLKGQVGKGVKEWIAEKCSFLVTEVNFETSVYYESVTELLDQEV